MVGTQDLPTWVRELMLLQSYPRTDGGLGQLRTDGGLGQLRTDGGLGQLWTEVGRSWFSSGPTSLDGVGVGSEPTSHRRGSGPTLD